MPAEISILDAPPQSYLTDQRHPRRSPKSKLTWAGDERCHAVSLLQCYARTGSAKAILIHSAFETPHGRSVVRLQSLSDG